MDLDKFSAYNKMSSAYREMECLVPNIVMGLMFSACRIAWAKGSSDRANSKGLKGQPCLELLDTLNEDEQCIPVITIAVAFERLPR